MKYLIYLGHPAHFHLFRITIQALRDAGHEVQIVIKSKDVLESLLQSTGWAYTNLYDGPRGSKIHLARSLTVRELELYRVARDFRPDVMIGTSAEITHVGLALGIDSIVANEDDYHVVPYFAYAAYPFATTILAPSSCNVGRWRTKTVAYNGYHELAYLHPNHFNPNPEVAKRLAHDKQPYFILRLAELTAHHDAGRKGIGAEVARRLVSQLSAHGRIYITSERRLEAEFERYRIAIDPSDIHSALAYATMYIGDSQTMAAEAAVLGTPSVRFNDFVGEIGYLNELEYAYGLTCGIKTSEPDRLHSVLGEWLQHPDLSGEWKRRRDRMLTEMIDVSQFLTGFLLQYPRAARRQKAAIWRRVRSQVSAG